MLTTVKAKMKWWKYNRNNIFHKFLAMIFPTISPTLINEISFAKFQKQVQKTRKSSSKKPKTI